MAILVLFSIVTLRNVWTRRSSCYFNVICNNQISIPWILAPLPHICYLGSQNAIINNATMQGILVLLGSLTVVRKYSFFICFHVKLTKDWNGKSQYSTEEKGQTRQWNETISNFKNVFFLIAKKKYSHFSHFGIFTIIPEEDWLTARRTN